MPQRSDAPGSSFPEDPQSQESTVGGADAVQKTSYATGRGAEPEGQRRPGDAPAAAAVGFGAARGSLIVVALVVLGGLIYLIAM
jgi:hypothetical protein